MIDEIKKMFEQISRDNDVLRVFTNHSLRVMYFATALGNRVGCNDFDLRVAALFHDIGKIGLSKEILFKPTKLNDLEYLIIQSHSHIGNTILRQLVGLEKAASYVRDHHERWDGKGYPRRLKGQAISRQGRIIAICDSFDTMTIERRTYKQETLSIGEAFEELRRCAWKQFDGALVEEFIPLIEELELPNFDQWYDQPEIMKAIFEKYDSANLEAHTEAETAVAGMPEAELSQEFLKQLKVSVDTHAEMTKTMSTEIKRLQEHQEALRQYLMEREHLILKLMKGIDGGNLPQ